MNVFFYIYILDNVKVTSNTVMPGVRVGPSDGPVFISRLGHQVH